MDDIKEQSRCSVVVRKNIKRTSIAKHRNTEFCDYILGKDVSSSDYTCKRVFNANKLDIVPCHYFVNSTAGNNCLTSIKFPYTTSQCIVTFVLFFKYSNGCYKCLDVFSS